MFKWLKKTGLVMMATALMISFGGLAMAEDYTDDVNVNVTVNDYAQLKVVPDTEAGENATLDLTLDWENMTTTTDNVSLVLDTNYNVQITGTASAGFTDDSEPAVAYSALDDMVQYTLSDDQTNSTTFDAGGSTSPNFTYSSGKYDLDVGGSLNPHTGNHTPSDVPADKSYSDLITITIAAQ